jgi:xanthine dehydrogenase YagT iron-sulfur-binding subunit
MTRKCRDGESCHGVSRRGFLSSVSAAPIATLAMGAEAKKASTALLVESNEKIKMSLRVNAHVETVLAEPRETLLNVLREKLGFTGTKPGCERGECGSCTVLIDGIPRYACMILAPEAEGREITTIEGLMKGEELGAVQRAFVEADALQCGYCTPGQVMATEGLLRTNPDPSPVEIRVAMSGNLCRCGAYDHIFKAVRRASILRREGGER